MQNPGRKQVEWVGRACKSEFLIHSRFWFISYKIVYLIFILWLDFHHKIKYVEIFRPLVKKPSINNPFSFSGIDYKRLCHLAI